jgi:hypothetical protein
MKNKINKNDTTYKYNNYLNLNWIDMFAKKYK